MANETCAEGGLLSSKFRSTGCFGQLLCAVGASALAACSSGVGDVGEGGDLEALRATNQARIRAIVSRAEERSEAQQAPLVGQLNAERDGYEDDFQTRATKPLSDHELLQLYAFFEESGTPPESVHLQGNVITLDDDILLYADEVLQALNERNVEDATEKGRLLAQVVTFGNPSVAPDLYARQVDDEIQFFRPLTTAYFVVVPDSPAFVFDLLLQATNTLVDLPDDQLTARTYSVIRQSEYDALVPQARAFNGRIDVIYGPLATACPGGTANTVACNIFPRVLPRTNDGRTFIQTMCIGNRMGIVNTSVTANTAFTRGVIMHELMHGLGVAHLENESFGAGTPNVLKLDIPGTQTALATPTLMHRFLNDPNWTNLPSAEDADVLGVLYSSSKYAGTFTEL